MYNYSKEISSFHAAQVRLTNDQRADMKRRRETNLNRINNGLEDAAKPSLAETINQGSYAQKTMTQPPENDQESRYDIDLGVVFEEGDEAGPRTTRNWIRDAIACKATNMKNEPVAKKKCVRIVYADGYQCDFPVFRRRHNGFGWDYELSSGDNWEASDPAAINKWIDSQVSTKSPETSGSYQLRRIIRMGKFYTKTHASRKNRKFPSGLVSTALFIDAYISAEGWDDLALRETLRNISYLSKYNAVYANHIQVSDDKDVDRIERLIVQAKASVRELDTLDAEDTKSADAQSVWKKVFCHSFFDEQKDASSTKNVLLEKMAGSILTATLLESERKRRMEAAVRSAQRSGAAKPWSL